MNSFTRMKYLFIGSLIFLACMAQAQNLPLELNEIASGLRSPVAGAAPSDGSGRLFIVEQYGVIRVIEDGALLTEPFLDIRSKLVNINSGYDERGLLGLAFHPNYAENGRFFVYYSAPGGGGNHSSVVAEYRVSEDPLVADLDERVIMRIPQPEGNHNGGHLAFGPDGMLYIALGDGGGAGDRHGQIGNGQNLNTLLGSILRIDVDGDEPYEVPQDNPFVDQEGEDEIWAYGLRNPWKFSFDRGGENRLFAGDVGQNQWEEVDIIVRGGNYGWRIMEGNHCYNPSTNCDQTGLILPIAEYDHREGISITGGYVYRGNRLSQLYGKYMFGDYGSSRGRLFYLEESGNEEWSLHEFDIEGGSNSSISPHVMSFLEDEQGELYVLTQSGGPTAVGGSVYHLTTPEDENLGSEDIETLFAIYFSPQKPTARELEIGDLNGDGAITPADAQILFNRTR